MHFSSHIKNITESMLGALREPKLILIKTLNENLLSAKELLKIDSFDYWINQIENNELTEIPTTIYGVEEASRIWHPVPDSRSSIESALTSTCEAILTYCAEDDICIAQSDYHYYFYIPTGSVFKESSLGFTPNLPAENISPKDTRIAHISELNVSSCELYNGS